MQAEGGGGSHDHRTGGGRFHHRGPAPTGQDHPGHHQASFGTIDHPAQLPLGGLERLVQVAAAIDRDLHHSPAGHVQLTELDPGAGTGFDVDHQRPLRPGLSRMAALRVAAVGDRVLAGG